jgi:DNA repair exonuclease SbcCD ATPase subunit
MTDGQSTYAAKLAGLKAEKEKKEKELAELEQQISDNVKREEALREEIEKLREFKAVPEGNVPAQVRGLGDLLFHS